MKQILFDIVHLKVGRWHFEVQVEKCQNLLITQDFMLFIKNDEILNTTEFEFLQK